MKQGGNIVRILLQGKYKPIILYLGNRLLGESNRQDSRNRQRFQNHKTCGPFVSCGGRGEGGRVPKYKAQILKHKTQITSVRIGESI